MRKNLYSPHQKISSTQRSLRLSDLLTLFFSFGIGLSVMQTGTVLAIGEGSISYTSILVGTLFGTALLGIIGSMGSHTGLSSMANLRLSFGKKGVILPTILNILQLIGWGSFGIIIIRDSLLFVLKSHSTSNPILLSLPFWSIVIGSLATFLAISGPLSVVRLFLKKFAIWIVLAANLWLTYHLFSIWNSAPIFHTPPKNLAWGAGCDVVVSLAFSYLPVVGDYTRFAPSRRGSFWGIFLGFSLGNLWLLSLGASYTLLSPDNADVHTLLSHLSLIGAGLPLFFLIINETDNLFVDIHSSSVSIALFLKSFSVRTLCILVGLICILVSIFVDLSSYLDFILAISSVFTPLFGIVLADFLAQTKGRSSDFSQNSLKNFRWSGLGTWVLGVIVFQLCKNSSVGGAIPALLFTFLLFGPIRMMTQKIFWVSRTQN